MSDTAHYRKPGWVTRTLFNPAVEAATRMGFAVWGSRVLETTGRVSGKARRTPVNLLVFDGNEYIISPRGETQWVRNVRAAGGRLVLIHGRHRQERVASELEDAQKPAVLRAYLRRWKMEIGVFFDGVDARSSEEDLVRIAPSHPVFVLNETGGAERS
jgi:deazaflavin-dependent oxidoreductase (nitroreductase family)